MKGYDIGPGFNAPFHCDHTILQVINKLDMLVLENSLGDKHVVKIFDPE